MLAALGARIRSEEARPRLRLLPARLQLHRYRLLPNRTAEKTSRQCTCNFSGPQLLADGSLPIIGLQAVIPLSCLLRDSQCAQVQCVASAADVGRRYSCSLPRSLDRACRLLAEFNWTPRYGMTGESLVRRSCMRRNSWNFTKGPGGRRSALEATGRSPSIGSNG